MTPGVWNHPTLGLKKRVKEKKEKAVAEGQSMGEKGKSRFWGKKEKEKKTGRDI